MEIFIIIFIIIVIPFLAYSNYKTPKREKEIQRLNDNRPHLTKTEYINILVDKGYKKEEIEVVYDEIEDIVQLKYISMYPEDCIYQIYEMHDLDDIDLFDNISKKFQLRKVEQKDIDSIGGEFKKVNAEYILTMMNNLKERD